MRKRRQLRTAVARRESLRPPRKRSGTNAKVAAELAALAVRGRISPQRVVGWAEAHPESALHGCFLWDDTEAAKRFRLWQARQLIVSVEVEYPDGKQRQVYVSPLSTRGGGGYVALVDAMEDADLRRELLSQALAELRRVCDKYEDLVELAGVRAAVRLVNVK